jgi:hypothetical protein
MQNRTVQVYRQLLYTVTKLIISLCHNEINLANFGVIICEAVQILQRAEIRLFHRN